MRIFERAAQSASAAGALTHADESIRLALRVLGEPGVTLSAEVAISATDVVIAYDALPVLISQVTAETIAKVGNVMRRVVMAGLTPHDAMRQLGAITGKGTFATAFHRAEAIVRTELHRIGGTALQRQLHEINQRRPGLYKKWLAVLDDRTRDAHRDAEGQVVPVDGFFIVGGNPMRFPGDPMGGADNVVNCRCMMVGWREGWG